MTRLLLTIDVETKFSTFVGNMINCLWTEFGQAEREKFASLLWCTNLAALGP